MLTVSFDKDSVVTNVESLKGGNRQCLRNPMTPNQPPVIGPCARYASHEAGAAPSPAGAHCGLAKATNLIMRTPNSVFLFAVLLSFFVCGTSPLIGAGGKSGDSPVSIIVPAQLLSAEIRIDSDDQVWESRLRKIEGARQFIRTAATSEGFSVTTLNPLIGHHPQYGGNATTVDMTISSSIDGKSDLIRIIQQYEGIISRLSVENKVSAAIGKIFLSVENPESYRNELLRQIRIYVESTSKALSDSPYYSVNGIEQAVQARQWGERDIELYIPFTVSYGRRAQPIESSDPTSAIVTPPAGSGGASTPSTDH
jgi:hypothetical protein